MKGSIALSCLLLATALAGCDMRSETAKREMEKFSGTPTPTFSPAPTEAPIDPSEVVNADLNLQGDPVNVSGYEQKKSIACTKFNPVTVNGGSSVITIKGPCRQIMVNGDGNRITIDAAIAIVLNGDKNIVQYARYVNGKRPFITDNAGSNTIEKIASPPSAH
ncbi:MAG: DUF3060 domain-containing protein [Acidobacteriota bacterium]